MRRIKALTTRLIQSGSVALQSAFRAFHAEDWNLFVTYSATAVELFTKARLAALNPALLTTGSHLPSLVWFADESKHDEPFPAELRTVSQETALERMYAIDSDTSKWKDSYDLLRRLRNGLAHLGGEVLATSGDLLAPLLRGILAITGGAGADPDDVFGDFISFAASQIKKHEDDEQRRYAGLVALAERRAEEFTSRWSEEEATRWKELVELRWHRKSVDDQLVPCPVCRYPAYVTGTLEHTGWDVDSDRDEMWAYPTFEFLPEVLRCPTCDLKLDTPGLIDLSAAMENWTLSDADADEAHEAVAESEAEDRWADRD